MFTEYPPYARPEGYCQAGKIDMWMKHSTWKNNDNYSNNSTKGEVWKWGGLLLGYAWIQVNRLFSTLPQPNLSDTLFPNATVLSMEFAGGSSWKTANGVKVYSANFTLWGRQGNAQGSLVCIQCTSWFFASNNFPLSHTSSQIKHSYLSSAWRSLFLNKNF